MIDLLKNYNISEVIILLIMFAIAIKSVITFWDWAVQRIKKVFNKQSKEEKEKEDVYNKIENQKNEISKLVKNQDNIFNQLKDLQKSIDLLISSDKDSIKAYITREHHYFCYQKKWVDDYSLDCLQRRFEHYKKEKGNSFVEELMNDIKDLPRIPPDNENEY